MFGPRKGHLLGDQMKIQILISLFIPIFLSEAFAFCGFYVAKADANLFNKASQVVMVRDQNRTVISMMNDYEGPLSEFAMVIPVPTVLQKEQIHVGERKMFSRVDSFTAPRLVEYYDGDPCMLREKMIEDKVFSSAQVKGGGASTKKWIIWSQS